MIELKTNSQEMSRRERDSRQSTIFGYKPDPIRHDCLAAHAYQQAVAWYDTFDPEAAEKINTRAAEILAQWMKGE